MTPRSKTRCCSRRPRMLFDALSSVSPSRCRAPTTARSPMKAVRSYLDHLTLVDVFSQSPGQGFPWPLSAPFPQCLHIFQHSPSLLSHLFPVNPAQPNNEERRIVDIALRLRRHCPFTETEILFSRFHRCSCWPRGATQRGATIDILSCAH